jgi:hypothetical protein
MMERLVVMMQPLPHETRLRVMAGRHEVMRAILGPTTASHARVALRLMAAFAPGHQQALSVVL